MNCKCKLVELVNFTNVCRRNARHEPLPASYPNEAVRQAWRALRWAAKRKRHASAPGLELRVA